MTQESVQPLFPDSFLDKLAALSCIATPYLGSLACERQLNRFFKQREQIYEDIPSYSSDLSKSKNEIVDQLWGQAADENRTKEEVRRLRLCLELHRIDDGEKYIQLLVFRHRAKRRQWIEAAGLFTVRALILTLVAAALGEITTLTWLAIIGVSAVSTQLRMARLDLHFLTDSVVDFQIDHHLSIKPADIRSDVARRYYPMRFRKGDEKIEAFYNSFPSIYRNPR